MRTIVKGAEPPSLTEWRASTHTNYEDYPDKNTLRGNLVKEQRGLCCYCLSRIRAESGSMKIEHWHSQDKYPAGRLDYSNLLAACLGNEGRASRDQHCDTRKGNRDISRNPANPQDRIEDIIQFQGDGKIGSTNLAFNKELTDVLNLNLPFLINNCKAALSAFQAFLRMRGELPRATLERMLRRLSGEQDSGELQPHCQVIVYWLRKRLRRA